MKIIDGIVVFCDPLEDGVLEQIKTCSEQAEKAVLCADAHVGMSMPIGGVCAYKDKISIQGVGPDIACGNKAVKLDMTFNHIKNDVSKIMDDLWNILDFGVGSKNKTPIDHELYDDIAWTLPVVSVFKDKAREQLGSIGSGNHFVNLMVDENENIWIANHFGSRGLGFTIASYFMKEAGGTDSMFGNPTLLDVNASLGSDYLTCMHLAGRYAYAGRDWVCQRVADMLGASIVEEVHNNHNFGWLENGLWVVRKGSTPAFPGQKGFVGGSMGDYSYIIEGVDSALSKDALYSTIHGAGRVMSRTRATGMSKWGKKKGKPEVTNEMMMDWVNNFKVELRGAGVDESPFCYKRIDEVLPQHEGTIRVLHKLKPIGVAMASGEIKDPYKD